MMPELFRSQLEFFQQTPMNLGVDVKISEDDRKILEKNL